MRNFAGESPTKKRKPKLEFASLYEYFEEKITKEVEALEAEQVLKTSSSKPTKNEGWFMWLLLKSSRVEKSQKKKLSPPETKVNM